MSTVLKEIEAVLAAAAAAIMRGAPAKEVAELMFDESVFVVESTGRTVRGPEELLASIEQAQQKWGASPPRIVFKVCEPVLAMDALAVTMVNTDIYPDKPNALALRYYGCMAWKRGKNGWRVAMEMSAVGSL